MKKKCLICPNRFEPVRSDAKYCSNACKQKAHTLKKKGDSKPKEAEMLFYMDEYQTICKRFGYDSETFSFLFFCFLRKNLVESANIESVIDYIHSIWTYNSYDELIESKSYQTFKEDYLSRRFCVLPNKVN